MNEKQLEEFRHKFIHDQPRDTWYPGMPKSFVLAEPEEILDFISSIEQVAYSEGFRCGEVATEGLNAYKNLEEHQ